MPEKPNIIIVMTDQQRADLRAAEGYPRDIMPFLDDWGRGGVDFARAYTPNPTCAPARASLFTGRYPSCHKVRTNHNIRDVYYERDMLDVLKSEGYVTALCGKNHSFHRPEDFDFHETNGHLGYEGETNTTPAEIEFADFLRATNHMETHEPSPGGVEVQHPYRNVSSFFKFIDGHDSSRPFFAWVSFAEPHNPYQVPKPYFDMFPPESLPPVHAGAECLPDKGRRYEWLRGVWQRVLGGDIERRILRARSNYLGMLRLIDDQFKRLILGLRERGIEQDCIVVFCSDHGDFAGEYGLIRKGVELSELLTRVPLIMRGPGILPRGRVDEACVSLMDLFPTLCAMLGVEIPFGVQGKSFEPLLKNTPYPKGEFDIAYSENGFGGLYWDDNDGLTLPVEDATDAAYTRFDCLNTWTQCGQVRMVRKGNWKIQEDMNGEVYLYDLSTDPYELHNLADSAAHVNVLADMLRELAAAVLRAQDPLPAPHNRYRVKVHPNGWWNDADWHSGDPGVRKDSV